MEEARSLDSRRIQIEYAPQRTANEILALAFELLTSEERSRRADRNSVQPRQKQDRSEVSFLQEVMR